MQIAVLIQGTKKKIYIKAFSVLKLFPVPERETVKDFLNTATSPNLCGALAGGTDLFDAPGVGGDSRGGN